MKPYHAALQRLYERDRKVGAGNSQTKPRQTRSRAYIRHGCAFGDIFLHGGTVEHVTSPQARYLARTNEPALNPRRRQMFHIALC